MTTTLMGYYVEYCPHTATIQDWVTIKGLYICIEREGGRETEREIHTYIQTDIYVHIHIYLYMYVYLSLSFVQILSNCYV